MRCCPIRPIAFSHPLRRLPAAALSLSIAVAILVGSARAHDLFLKLDRYSLPAETKVSIALLNGTFDRSDNVITRDRMSDVRIVGPSAGDDGDVVRPDAADWRDVGDTSILDFETGGAGTYVIGVSTKSRVIELSAEDFNAYLEHDGVLDVLERRRSNGRLDASARERYSKHVKAIYRVGDAATDAWKSVFGYPVEIVPLADPTALAAGDTLRVRILRSGKPLAGQLVYASHEGHHEHDEAGGHVEAVRTRTDESGIATIEVGTSGVWYVRLIHMREVDEPDIDYESNWATLTFAAR